jgi:hypothetical protein
MLHALLRNKLGRTLEDGSLDPGTMSAVLRSSEDAITACIFRRFLLLPPERAAQTVAGVLVGDAEPFGGSYPLAASFWPSLRHSGARVEPDVVLEYEDRVVVVEVKWGSSHEEGQWCRELRAAHERFPGRRALHLVLAGRERESSTVAATLAPCAARMAVELGREVRAGWLSFDRLFRALNRHALPSGHPWELAALADIRDALADRGLRETTTFASLAVEPIRTTPAELATNCTRSSAWSSAYSRRTWSWPRRAGTRSRITRS